MKLIVGLGNPGEKYKNNRHNVGYMLIDYLINELRITDYGLKPYKTDCYMNESGKFVKKLIRNSQSAIEQLIIVHDDLDIPLGKFKIQKGTGPQLHNGIESVENQLKTKNFWRIRIGVDNRPKTGWIDGETYVLQNFRLEEKEIVNQLFISVLDRIKRLLSTFAD